MPGILEKIGKYKESPTTPAGLEILRAIRAGELQEELYEFATRLHDDAVEDAQEHWDRYEKGPELIRMREELLKEVLDALEKDGSVEFTIEETRTYRPPVVYTAEENS